MRRFGILFVAALLVTMFIASLAVGTADAWDLGITYHEPCEGYGIDVNPGTYQSGNYKYVPYETQVNNGGGWNPVPYSDHSGGLNPWNPSGQHNYEVKIRYHVYKWVIYHWVLQSNIHTEGPVHHRVEKPDDCYQVCSETTEVGPVSTDPDWGPWTYNPSTGMEERFRTVVHTYTFVDARDGKTVCGTREVEEEQMQSRWNVVVGYDNDCAPKGWEVFYIKGGNKVVVASGVWTDPYTLEPAEFGPFGIPIEEGEDIIISDPLNLMEGGVISEPADCFVCKVTEKYRMLTLIDYDAPDWYWGQGSRNGTCWVIMYGDAEDAAMPSVERQAEICSVCAHPDFVYEADKVLYDEWVMVDCQGNIIYPDPLWSSDWFKPNFDGTCHEPSCLNPDVKP